MDVNDITIFCEGKTEPKMGISNSGRVLITLLLVCGLLHCAAAGKIYNVGGDVGWTSQFLNSPFYQDWADSFTLYVGDALNFTLGDHDVVEILVENLAACDNSTFIAKGSGSAGSMAIIGYDNAAGTYGFISDIGTDCSQFGMHFHATWYPLPSPLSHAGTPVATPATTPSLSPAWTPIATPAATPSLSRIATPAATPSLSPAWTPGATPSLSPAGTPVATPTATPSLSPVATPAATPSLSPAGYPVGTPAATPSLPPAGYPIGTPAATPSLSPAGYPVGTPAATPSLSPAWTPVATPAVTPSLSPAGYPVGTPAATPAGTPC